MARFLASPVVIMIGSSLDRSKALRRSASRTTTGESPQSLQIYRRQPASRRSPVGFARSKPRIREPFGVLAGFDLASVADAMSARRRPAAGERFSTRDAAGCIRRSAAIRCLLEKARARRVGIGDRRPGSRREHITGDDDDRRPAIPWAWSRHSSIARGRVGVSPAASLAGPLLFVCHSERRPATNTIHRDSL